MPDTNKSVSALATKGHVLDKSKTNPFEKTGHGFVYNISTYQDVVDIYKQPTNHNATFCHVACGVW